MRRANGFVRRIPKNADGARGFKKNVKRLARSVLMRAQLTLNATMKKINGFVSGIPRIAAGTHGFKKNAKRLATNVLMMGQLMLNAKIYSPCLVEGMPETVIQCSGCKRSVKKRAISAPMKRTMELIIKKRFLTFKLFCKRLLSMTIFFACFL